MGYAKQVVDPLVAIYSGSIPEVGTSASKQTMRPLGAQKGVSMAHTNCCCDFRIIAAPTEEGDFELIENKFKKARRYNRDYSYNIRSWKRGKVKRQWERHMK